MRRFPSFPRKRIRQIFRYLRMAHGKRRPAHGATLESSIPGILHSDSQQSARPLPLLDWANRTRGAKPTASSAIFGGFNDLNEHRLGARPLKWVAIRCAALHADLLNVENLQNIPWSPDMGSAIWKELIRRDWDNFRLWQAFLVAYRSEQDRPSVNSDTVPTPEDSVEHKRLKNLRTNRTVTLSHVPYALPLYFAPLQQQHCDLPSVGQPLLCWLSVLTLDVPVPPATMRAVAQLNNLVKLTVGGGFRIADSGQGIGTATDHSTANADGGGGFFGDAEIRIWSRMACPPLSNSGSVVSQEAEGSAFPRLRTLTISGPKTRPLSTHSMRLLARFPALHFVQVLAVDFQAIEDVRDLWYLVGQREKALDEPYEMSIPRLHLIVQNLTVGSWINNVGRGEWYTLMLKSHLDADLGSATKCEKRICSNPVPVTARKRRNARAKATMKTSLEETFQDIMQ